jgi:hypothetical protein
MPAGMNFALGLQRVLDAQQRYVRNSLPMYLRLRNFAPVTGTLAGQLGFSISPSGTPNVGTTDILIDPPPAQRMVSMHNIGISGGKLMLGARSFLISNSFVVQMMAQLNITNPNLVWEGNQTVGIVTDSKLFSVVEINHSEIAGATVSWDITANAQELK